MIESEEQLLGDFRAKAEAFFASPNPLTGIDFDDATVAFKRYVVSVLGDQALASVLASFQKPIRQLDVDALRELLARVEERLGSLQAPD
jgi:hypothetical protein